MYKLRTLSIALLFAVGSAILTERSEAFLIGAVVTGGEDSELNRNLLISCIVFIPFCLFNDISESQNEIVLTDFLEENGYDPNQIAQITADQEKITSALSRMHAKIEISSEDSVDSIRAGLQKLVPDISELYIQFIAEYAPRKEADPTSRAE